jgi:type II secretory pathway pseudopilin PulG
MKKILNQLIAQKRRKKSNQNTHGRSFTLIEVMLCIGIVLMLLSMGLPSSAFYTQALLYREIDLLYATCSYLQQASIAAGKKHILYINKKERLYFYLLRGIRTIKHSLYSEIDFGSLPESLGPPASPNHLIVDPITFPTEDKKNYTITFYPDGTISAGSIYVRTKRHNFMAALTYQVGGISSLRTYRYQQGMWTLR